MTQNLAQQLILLRLIRLAAKRAAELTFDHTENRFHITTLVIVALEPSLIVRIEVIEASPYRVFRVRLRVVSEINIGRCSLALDKLQVGAARIRFICAHFTQDEVFSRRINQTTKLRRVASVGENIADLGGLKIAYLAFQKSLEGKPRPPAIDGFTPEQRFFLSFAQNWRRSTRPEALRLMLATDPHSPPRFRVLGPISNMPEFFAAFNCKPGDSGIRAENVQVKIW
jgi:hypothetical protein